MKTIQKVCKIIKKHNRFLITSHYEPEADAIGSQLAMADLLRQLGKCYAIINQDKVPKRYRFLPGTEKIKTHPKNKFNFDVAIVLDSADIQRVGNVIKLLGGKTILNIDHHISNTFFGDINLVDTSSSSTGEIVYGFVERLGCRLNRNLALDLYAAILTDTGAFRYSNTTSRTLNIAAELLKCGLSPKGIYERLFESHSPAARRLLGLCLATLKITTDGEIAWMRLEKPMFKKTGARFEDAENFVNFARFIEGVRIAALFCNAVKDGYTKVSLRSNGEWADVNRVASKFKGGGHFSASGCLVKGCIAEVEKKVLKEIRKELNR